MSTDHIDIALGIEQVVNRAQITIYPVQTVGAAQVIWTARTVLRLAPGQTRVIHALFHDENGERTGAQDVIAPAAHTDYRVNDRADGTGFDYTISLAFALSTVIEATQAEITLSNSALGPLYVTLLQVRGKPIRVFDPITVESEDAASPYGTRALVLDLPLQGDDTFAQSYADYIVGRFKDPVLAAASITFRNRDTINDVPLFSLGLLDRVMLSDAHTGLRQVAHRIHAVEYDLTPGATQITLHLERAAGLGGWLLGKTGYSEMDAATRLGF